MMTADNLSIESLDAKLSQLFELFDRQHLAICDIQHRLVNLESNVCNDDAISSWSDFTEAES